MGIIDGNLVMITDLAENGSLERVIRLRNRSGEKLDWDTKTRITSETTSALAYLHSLGIIHRDVKSANILLTKHFEVRLCDLSHALFTSVPDILDDKGSFGRSTKALVGTIRWMAPELLGTAPEYSFKSDMYALGMVMWEMAANCTIPYQDEPNNNRVVEYVLSGGRETIPSDTPDEYRQCIERYWDQDPFKRPNASEMVPKPSIRFEYLATKGESMISDSTSSSSTKNDDDWPLPNNHQVKCSPTFALPVNAVATTNTLSSRTLADDSLLQMAASGVLPLPQENSDGVFDTLPILNLWTLRPTLPYLSEISDICANCFHQVSMGNKSSQLFLAVGVFAAVKAFQLTILQHITGYSWE
ncbi:hypothetical protein BGW42_007094 [Actinomortierella wolfii]|nr:hypothetical protein BGW42_007094 [Actinomortierella wolfii]